MESRSAKRKRCGDIKNDLVDQLHRLTANSFQLSEDLQLAGDDFVLMFKSMSDRQSELYARSVGIEEKYGELIALLKGDPGMHVGETSRQRTDLPSSYALDTQKFINDTLTSLDGHSKSFVEKIEEMIKEIEDHSSIWKGKVTEMKKQAEHIVCQRRSLAVELLDFKKNI